MADGNIRIENTEISVSKAVVIVLAIGAAIIGVFNTVILPLNNIQVQLLNIQATLADNKSSINNFNSEQIAQDARITVMEDEIKAINQKLGIK